MLTILLSVTTIHWLALMSPGPDFFFVSQMAAKTSPKESFKGVLGITLGVMIWSGIALLGLHIILEKWDWLRTGLVIAGAGYLSYLAFLLLRSAFIHQTSTELDSSPFNSGNASVTVSGKTAELPKIVSKNLFWKGLFTNLANPKAVAYFGSVFSMLITDSMGLELKLIIFLLIAVETLIWFMIVARVFSLPSMQRGYQRLTRWIDGVTGVLFGSFALYFVYSEVKRYWNNW